MSTLLPDPTSSHGTDPHDGGLDSTYRVDCCHTGAEPVAQAELDDDAKGDGWVMSIGLIVAALEAAVVLVRL